MSIYASLKGIYHAVLPARMRTILWTNPITRKPREWLLRRAETLASDDELYSEEYFANAIDGGAAKSAPIIAADLIEAIHPRSVVDVGCGTGQLLMAFRDQQVPGRGLEFAPAGIKICKSRGLDVQRFDIEHDQPVDWRADLVVSTEVAEHLPPHAADRYVDLLCGIAATVFITAAIPGSTGTDHVNEQPNSYWIEKFSRRGYQFMEDQSHRWRREWKAKNVQDWYYASAMLFKK